MKASFALFIAAAAFAQQQDTLVSPEVHPDRTITFRLRAPKATEVAVAGEWTRTDGLPNAPQKLSKGADGVWSGTVGPVDPNTYIYVFNVDGMTITDPVNPSVKLRARTNASMVSVPGEMPWEFRDVPHGSVEINLHKSAVLNGAMRQICVYTPPGYDKNRSQRYPVLYLLHGSNDLEVGWTMAGKANLILDNLQAEKKAVPMIVVMPWGHALPFGARPAAGQIGNNELYEQYLLNEVVPLVEAKYRIAPGRQNRAIMGLSMGGSQALQIAMGHLDQFGSLGVFGSGISRPDFDTRYRTAAAELSKPEKRLTVVFVGVGKLDPVAKRAKELSDALTAHGVKNTFYETDGGHTYPVWRKLLVESAPMLFKKADRRQSD
jgi:enterochelin esterase family protein